MNNNRLRKLLEPKGAKANILRKTGLTRPTLDNILAGGDFMVSNLEKICDALGIHVAYLFDEDGVAEVRKAGRDYYEQHDDIRGIKNIQTNSQENSQTAFIINTLQGHIRALEAQIKDKDTIINLLKSQSSEVK